MNNKTMLQRSLLTTGITLALGLSFGLSQNALADSADDTLDVKAGLVQAMTLTCDTALSFGITRLGVLDRGSDTTITVNPADGELSTGGATTGVSTGTGQAGSCVVAGSNATGLVTVTVGGEQQAPGDASVGLDGDVGAFSDLVAPEDDALSLSVDNFTLDNASINLSNGGATFNIGAELTIPGLVEADQLGGYSNTITVYADDGFGSS